MITIDNNIGKIVAKLHIFSYIHPNIITFVGMICNILLYYGSVNACGTHIIALLLLLRWFTDVMDGNVAREYNKTSKLGGLLDTLTDTSFSMILVHLVALKFYGVTCATVLGILCGMYIICYMLYCGSIFDHANIKTNDTILKYCIALFVENTLIAYIGIVILNYMYGIL